MTPIDRVGPSLPANPLRRVEERRRERDQRPSPPPKPPAPPTHRPDGDDDHPHLIDELA